jgi:hypothetical protein
LFVVMQKNAEIACVTIVYKWSIMVAGTDNCAVEPSLEAMPWWFAYEGSYVNPQWKCIF